MIHHRPLSPAAARALAPLLEALAAQAALEERIGYDPVDLPHRYQDPRDIEVVALLSALLAYGRADLFKPKIEGILSKMGRSPARLLERLDPAGAARLTVGFVYRFNVATDVAALLMGIGAAVREQGGLEPLFAGELARHGALRPALAGFTRTLRQRAPLVELRRHLGPERGLDHLLPSRPGPGAAKRLLLFLRWMVRGPDRVDFGLWTSIPRSALVIPLDTHVARLARHLGLSRRKDLSWRTAEEITRSLRLIDPEDPVRFDFALCHHGMSGRCPARPHALACAACALRSRCRSGRQRVNSAGL